MSGEILVGGSREAGLLHVCLNCGAVASGGHGRLPLTISAWSDLPLPEGWRWVLSDVAMRDGAPSATPLCAECVSLLGTEPFHARRAHSRDLAIPGAMSARR